MRSNKRMIAIAAGVAFLMPGLHLCADGGAKPSDAAKADKAAGSSLPSAPDPAPALTADPTPSLTSGAEPSAFGMSRGYPRVEIFLGYSYLRAVPTLAEGNRLMWLNGASASFAFNMNRSLGLVGDFGAYTNSKVKFTGGYTSTVDVNNANVGAFSYLFGPRLSFRQHERITPFVQALFGGMHANQVTLTDCTFSCTLLPSQSSFAMTAGGGLDLRVDHHIAIRLIQAEYLMTRFTSYTTGSGGTQNDMRLSAGLVNRFGGARRAVSAAPAPPSPLSYSCSVTPSAVYPGEPIAVVGTAVNLNPSRTAVYSWTANGGTVAGTSNITNIDTSGATPGSYTLKGHVSEGTGAEENADCSAPYEVKAYDAPTVSCSANPSLMSPGETATITADAASPQNRPLTYSYTSTSGTVAGTGRTATLSTTGAAPGVVTVNCIVADDVGHTVSSPATVTLQAPAVAEKPAVSQLCSIHFDRDAGRPSRVDNEAKACLDEIALNLQRNSDATLAIVGNAAHEERNSKALASQRAVNTKAYLVREKGIDASRVVVYSGHQDAKTASATLIPAGATFDSAGDTPIH